MMRAPCVVLILVAAAAAQSGPCSWSVVSSAPFGLNDNVDRLRVLDDGSGAALYALGAFLSISAPVVKWDGTTWTPMPVGTAGGGATDITVFDDGSGPALYISTIAAPGASSVLRWNGSAWVDPPGGGPSGSNMRALAVIDYGNGPRLMAAGIFDGGIHEYDGISWVVRDTVSVPSGCTPSIEALHTWDYGTGPGLYVAGTFDTVGGNIPTNSIARWSPNGWETFASGIPPDMPCGGSTLRTLEIYDSGLGPQLYAGGFFNTVGTSLSSYGITTGWSQVGNGFSPAVGCGVVLVQDMEVFDDGGGPALYAAGRFTAGPGTAFVSKWDGTSWTGLGAGVGSPTCLGTAKSLAVFDDGNGPALYVASNPLTGIAGTTQVFARYGCSPGPAVQLSQPGPGSPVWISNSNLTPGKLYRNVFSDSCSGPVGSGGFFGLCYGDGSLLLMQATIPPGTPPFNWFATASTAQFGPFVMPPSAALDAICAEISGGTVVDVGTVTRIIVQ